MADRDQNSPRNPRVAGLTRDNARVERRRIMHADFGERGLDPGDVPHDDTLVLFLTTPPEPTSEQLQIAAENAFGHDATHYRDGWEFSVRWAARRFTYHPEQCLRPACGAT